MPIQAVIFDLDGVIVSTDEYHFHAWKKMADEEGIYFDKAINERLRGVSRMESLAIILERAEREYSSIEKDSMAERKNSYYRQSLLKLTPNEILPGTMKVLKELKRRNIKVAIGSSSKNTPIILKRIGLGDYFDAVADGNGIEKSKPDPEVFLLAAKLLNELPENCAVVEDAEAGIEAALAGNMYAVGVGSASNCEQADYGAKDLLNVNIDKLLNKHN